MNTVAAKLQKNIQEIEDLFHRKQLVDFDRKISGTKWSKKEILGHLIDSAINNLQRFTEIQYLEKPYSVRPYNPDELVKANRYQEKDSSDLLLLWVQLNRQIAFVMLNQTEDTLAYPLLLPDNQQRDLRFLMTDYVVHLEHHLKAIKNEANN
ncbi:DinB family protein [Flavobacterium sp. UBA4197]|uniref:DinB family protein n=1 Tax=Flavobacterium sp. UBA4197 TaxID=1946546 RepID=UPI00257D7E76|nr:DinB family protein [Flavobacterium sp. UBA4197]